MRINLNTNQALFLVADLLLIAVCFNLYITNKNSYYFAVFSNMFSFYFPVSSWFGFRCKNVIFFLGKAMLFGRFRDFAGKMSTPKEIN